MTVRPLLRTTAAAHRGGAGRSASPTCRSRPPPSPAAQRVQQDNAFLGAETGLSDVDQRGLAKPTAAQQSAASSLGAVGALEPLRHSREHLPASPGTSGPPRATPPPQRGAGSPRTPPLLGLSKAQVADLELVNSQKLADSSARAVLFRQRFGSLAPAVDGLVTVGVGNGAVQYVSSSLSRSTAAPAAAVLTPTAAWVKAATERRTARLPRRRRQHRHPVRVDPVQGQGPRPAADVAAARRGARQRHGAAGLRDQRHRRRRLQRLGVHRPRRRRHRCRRTTPEHGRQRQRRLPVPGRRHRRPSAARSTTSRSRTTRPPASAWWRPRSTASTTSPSSCSPRAAPCSPRSDTATSPEAAHLRGRLDPPRRLRDAGLPVRRPRRAVHRTR